MRDKLKKLVILNKIFYIYYIYIIFFFEGEKDYYKILKNLKLNV